MMIVSWPAELDSSPGYISITESARDLFVIHDEFGDVIGMYLLEVFLLAQHLGYLIACDIQLKYSEETFQIAAFICHEIFVKNRMNLISRLLEFSH